MPRHNLSTTPLSVFYCDRFTERSKTIARRRGSHALQYFPKFSTICRLAFQCLFSLTAVVSCVYTGYTGIIVFACIIVSWQQFREQTHPCSNKRQSETGAVSGLSTTAMTTAMTVPRCSSVKNHATVHSPVLLLFFLFFFFSFLFSSRT